uniref:Uncharacterized protein n=1 Tax=Lotharella oceanica TaxID=641309 RepID=A0A7S2TH91_9EUKA|mmetsp:Transcript_14166/g.26978  ORF Transcript_14166/g.26978 Transcript_14166/m.26978 type:complete len:144 (+) Transcript_14166:493-924(+)
MDLSRVREGGSRGRGGSLLWSPPSGTASPTGIAAGLPRGLGGVGNLTNLSSLRVIGGRRQLGGYPSRDPSDSARGMGGGNLFEPLTMSDLARGGGGGSLDSRSVGMILREWTVHKWSPSSDFREKVMEQLGHAKSFSPVCLSK